MDSSRSGIRSSAFWVFAALALVLALVWAFVLREASARDTALEYEVFRNASALLETAMQDPSALASDSIVKGFGIYGADGTPTFLSGAAPQDPDLLSLGTRPSRLVIKENSVILLRALGAEGARMGMMRAMGRNRGAPTPLFPSMPLAQNSARYLWIEYGLGAFKTERRLIFAGAALASAALLAGALLVARLSARNRDLADRASRDRELIQLGEAARTIAHEIKNPLGIIRVQSALARKRSGGIVDTSLAVIDQETRRLAELSDRIGLFLRSDEGRPETIDLAAFLEDFARRYGETCLVVGDFAALIAHVRIDPERLRGALDNLGRNAMEAAEEAGAEAVFELNAIGKRGRVEISISDRGSGVVEGFEERVFEPFFTTKAKGSGIGLAIARRSLERAGGGIRYRPREGGGAVFSISLPLETGADKQA